MKTRNAGAAKSSPAAKKTPPAKKSASKAQPSPSVETPETVETKRTSARAAKQVKKTDTTTPVTASKRRQSSAEDSTKATLGSKDGVVTPPVARRTSGRLRTPASVYVAAQAQAVKAKGKGSASNKKKTVDIKDEELTEENVKAEYDGEPVGMEETADVAEAPAVEKVGVSATEEKGAVGVEVDPGEEEEVPIEMEECVVEEVAKSAENVSRCDEGVPVGLEESVIKEVAKSSVSVLPCDEEDPIGMEESVAKEVARSSENVLPCAENDPIEMEGPVVEEVPRSSESVLPFDEEDPIEMKNSVVEEVAKSSENESPYEKDSPVAVEKSVTEEVVKSLENELLCDGEIPVAIMEESVVKEVAKSSLYELPFSEVDPIEIEESVIDVITKSSENRFPCDERERMEVKAEHKEDFKDHKSNEQTYVEPANYAQNDKGRLQGEGTNFPKEMYDVDEEIEEYGEKIDLGENGEEELPGDDADDHQEESVTLEDERKQLTAIAKERKIKKERELFLDGLDPDVEEEDVRRIFERIGGIVEVRLQKTPSTNENKGYAYVEFKDKEHVRRALSEIKYPAIRGKRCGIAPSEDNTSLFIGNICNTWTKEAIKQKLKDYEVECVENINLVPDIRHEGLSRGFAFVEFSCHGDAMLAYKRLQQPDVIFGHPERTAKVAFAEPICEPDPEVMAQVKSIFVDGLPSHWDEKHVREQFKGYGEILRVVLARNMSKAKRKDFGFVHFSSHESAVACVNVINNTPLDDGNLKIKVKARLSNPLPKTQAVKGGIRGGFRIGHGGGGVSRFGRDSGRSRSTSNRANFQRDRHFYDGERGHTSRMSFSQRDNDHAYAEFHGRGGRRGFSRGGGGGSGVASQSTRPYVDTSSHGAPDTGRGMPRGQGIPAPFRGHPYSPGGHFDRPHRRAHFDGPHMSGHLHGPQMRGHLDGPHMRGHIDGPHMRGHLIGPHMRGHLDGPHTRGHLIGPHMRGHFDGPNMGRHFDRPHMEGNFNGPPMGGHFDEHVFHDGRDRAQGKRPFHMRDRGPDYLEPSRHRPRLTYNDPTASVRGNHFNDTYGAGGNLYPHQYHGPESHIGPHSSYDGRNQSYGRGRYY